LSRKGPLFILPWRCTKACTQSCLHCGFAANPPAPDALGTEETKRIIDEIYDFGASFLGLGGGEPLMRRDLPELISYARKVGLNVSLLTSGYFLDDKIFDNLVRNGVRISISVDGTEDINDAIREKGAYAKALSAIKQTSKAGLLDCLVATLAKVDAARDNVNSEDMEHVIKLAQEYGARWMVVHGFIPFNRTKEHLAKAPSPQQYEKIWNEVYDLSQKYKGKPEVNVYCPFYARVAKQRGMPNFNDWFKNFFLGKCAIAGKYMSVIENGEVIPCSFNDRIRVGTVQKKRLKQIWNELQTSDFALKLGDRNNLKGKCGVCEYRDICGGCRTRAEMYTGDIFASDPACGYIPRSLRTQ
jgi:radical SAM protein with 4Fe4S-binding SPASM domain